MHKCLACKVYFENNDPNEKHALCPRCRQKEGLKYKDTDTLEYMKKPPGFRITRGFNMRKDD